MATAHVTLRHQCILTISWNFVEHSKGGREQKISNVEVWTSARICGERWIGSAAKALD
jgi:hypothetical protein